jgi:hypothetical protein
MLLLLACLVVWLVFTFIVPVGLGIVHALLGISVALLMRWWVLARARPLS